MHPFSNAMIMNHSMSVSTAKRDDSFTPTNLFCLMSSDLERRTKAPSCFVCFRDPHDESNRTPSKTVVASKHACTPIKGLALNSGVATEVAWSWCLMCPNNILHMEHTSKWPRIRRLNLQKPYQEINREIVGAVRSLWINNLRCFGCGRADEWSTEDGF